MIRKELTAKRKRPLYHISPLLLIPSFDKPGGLSNEDGKANLPLNLTSLKQDVRARAKPQKPIPPQAMFAPITLLADWIRYPLRLGRGLQR